MTNPPTDDPLTTLERLLKERDEAKAEYHLAIKKPFQSGVLWWTSKQRYEKADAVLTKHLRNLAPALVEVEDDAGLVDRIATALRQAREEGRKEQQITAETVPETWPSRGPDFNRWYCDAAAFVALVQKYPSMWLKNWQLKYLDIRIDTRSGHFVLYDRDKQPVSPNAVLEAIAQRANVEVSHEG